MHLHQASLERAESDLVDLLENIKDPQEKYYLSDSCKQALKNLGHDPEVCELTVTRYFKRTLQ